MNINSHTTLNGLGAFPRRAPVVKAGAAEGRAVKADGAADKPSVTVVRNDFLADIGDAEVTSAVEADIGFGDDIARMFNGYAFTEGEIPPFDPER